MASGPGIIYAAHLLSFPNQSAVTLFISMQNKNTMAQNTRSKDIIIPKLTDTLSSACNVVSETGCVRSIYACSLSTMTTSICPHVTTNAKNSARQILLSPRAVMISIFALFSSLRSRLRQSAHNILPLISN